MRSTVVEPTRLPCAPLITLSPGPISRRILAHHLGQVEKINPILLKLCFGAFFFLALRHVIRSEHAQTFETDTVPSII